MGNWYPSLEGQLPDAAVKAVRRVFDLVYGIGSRVGKMEATGFLSLSEAEKRYGPTAASRALSVQGQQPLNVAGLVGVLAQPQKAYVPFVDALPNILHDPLSQDGTLVSFNGQVYWFDGRTEPGSWKPLAALASVLADTRANRLANYPASNYPLNILFWETDTKLLYRNVGTYGASNWTYTTGTWTLTQAEIAGMGLGQYDDGLLAYVSDFHHTLKWTWGGGPGSLGWAPGEDGSGYIGWFAVAPTGVGWKLADGTGSPVTYLLATGATATVALPDLTAGVYPKGAAAYTGVVNAATGSAVSGNTAAGTAHSHGAGTLDPAAASAGTPTGTNASEFTHTHGPGTLVTGGESAVAMVTGGAMFVAGSPHTHNVTGGATAAGSAHTHTFTGDAMAEHDHGISGDTAEESGHTHGAGTLTAAPTEPKNIELLPYFRQ